MKRNLLQIALLIGAIILIVLGVSFLFPSQPPQPPRTLPNPNGYDTFVRAGTMISLDVQRYRKMDREELQALLDANTNALQLMRTGLTQQCLVPLERFQSPTA